MEKVCFITLTYSKQKDIKDYLLDFNNFIENIKLKFGEIKFLFTYEYQHCGTIVFHILTNQVLSDVIINKFWKHGLFNIKVNCDKNLVLDYLKVLTMNKKCIVCEFDFVWELGSKYCWNCVNKNVILINQYYSRLEND